MSELSEQRWIDAALRLEARAIKAEAEVARLRAWLQWMVVDDTDAQAALRGDEAPKP